MARIQSCFQLRFSTYVTHPSHIRKNTYIHFSRIFDIISLIHRVQYKDGQHGDLGNERNGIGTLSS